MPSMKRTWIAKRGVLPLLVLGAFALGFMLRGGGDSRNEGATDHADHATASERWTCAMHPQIQLPEPGKCPICFMDLIPVDSGAGMDASGRRLAMSEAAKRLAEIRTTPVRARHAETEIRMAGKVDYDETRLTYVTARVPARLDRLYVDYTGIRVRSGDHMVDTPHHAIEVLRNGIAKKSLLIGAFAGLGQGRF